MRKTPNRTIVAVLAAGLLAPQSTLAQDASFGCKVLLCAAASNPSWRGISYCVPVMNQLFAMLHRKGGSWPICGEAKVGAPRHEPFAECPAATTAVSLSGDRSILDPQGEWCQRADRSQSESAADAQAAAGLIPRQRRAEPWFVVLDGPDGPRRFYFAMGQ